MAKIQRELLKSTEEKNKELENKNKEINKLVKFSNYILPMVESIFTRGAYILKSRNISTLSTQKLPNLLFLSYYYIDTLRSSKNNNLLMPTEIHSVPKIVSSILEIISLKIKNNKYTLLDQTLTNLLN